MKATKTVSFNYGFLKDKITQMCGTQAVFAEKLGISKQSLSNKLNNKSQFSHDEIYRISVLLQLDNAEIGRCFFIARQLKTFTPEKMDHEN